MRLAPEAFLLILGGIIAIIALCIWRYMTAPRRHLDQWLYQLQLGRMPDTGKKDSDIRLISNFTELQIIPLKDPDQDRFILPWQKVKKVTAYKLDLLATDLVCVEFMTDDGEWINVDEGMEGFADLFENLPKHLSGALSFFSWYMDIRTPAFEPNPTILFELDQQQETQSQIS